MQSPSIGFASQAEQALGLDNLDSVRGAGRYTKGLIRSQSVGLHFVSGIFRCRHRVFRIARLCVATAYPSWSWQLGRGISLKISALERTICAKPMVGADPAT